MTYNRTHENAARARELRVLVAKKREAEARATAEKAKQIASIHTVAAASRRAQA